MEKYKFQEELDVLTEALSAAKEATHKMINDNPGVWFPCGFSWVKIKPARGKFISMLKDRGVGSTSYGGGYRVYNPSNNPTQWMDAKMEGSRAFAAVLKKHGINAIAEQQID